MTKTQLSKAYHWATAVNGDLGAGFGNHFQALVAAMEMEILVFDGHRLFDHDDVLRRRGGGRRKIT